jgi:K(+)-stimulated pyrophosphate-energized sodium pump
MLVSIASIATLADPLTSGVSGSDTRQYKTIAIMAVVLAAILYAGYRMYPPTAPLATKVVFSFLVGAILLGNLRLHRHVRLHPRQHPHRRRGPHQPGRALKLALRGGAVTGLIVVGLSLLGIGSLFLLFGGLDHPQAVPYQLVGFGFGASLVALFAQLGGGIYTKAADVGADLVGKVEAGIPEDDPRNPAVIADLVGDNVGDCAGRGADIFESTAAENVGAMILGAALYPVFGIKGILFPLIVHAINIVASIIGVSSCRAKRPKTRCTRSIAASTSPASSPWSASPPPSTFPPAGSLVAAGRGVVGIVTSFLFVSITEYYTETRYRPCSPSPEPHSPARPPTSSPASPSAWRRPLLPVIVISGALLLSYYFGVRGLADDATSSPTTPRASTARPSPPWACSRAAYILAMDTFGPITDNAGGIIEMSTSPMKSATAPTSSTPPATPPRRSPRATPSARPRWQPSCSSPPISKRSQHRRDRVRVDPSLDSPLPPDWSFTNINLASVPVFVGALLGAMLTYLFSSMAIKRRRPHSADGGRRRPRPVQRESRHHERHLAAGLCPLRQHRHRRRAQGDGDARRFAVRACRCRRRSLPHLSPRFHLTRAAPICPSFGNRQPFRSGSRRSLLMVGTISGILLAMLMNNGGGAWDNAKKFIETGQYGGKGPTRTRPRS